MSHRRRIRLSGRHGRRALAWFLVGFGLLQLAVDGVVDGLWPRIRSPHLALMEDEITALPSSPEVVILGSSRLGLAVSAKDAAMLVSRSLSGRTISVFNGSIQSEDFCTAEHVWHRLQARGCHPKIVIVEITPEMLAHKNRWLGAHVLPPFDEGNRFDYLAELWESENLGRLAAERALPVYRYRKDIQREIQFLNRVRPGSAAKAEPTTVPAALPIPGQTKSLFAAMPAGGNAPSRAELFLDSDPGREAVERTLDGLPRFRKWLRHFRVGGSVTRALERLLAQWHEDNVKVVLLFPPVSTPHRELYRPEIETSFQAYIEGLRERYQCEFIDWRDRLPDKLLFDNHHVSWNGMIAVTTLVANEVLTPRLQGTGEAPDRVP